MSQGHALTFYRSFHRLGESIQNRLIECVALSVCVPAKNEGTGKERQLCACLSDVLKCKQESSSVRFSLSLQGVLLAKSSHE